MIDAALLGLTAAAQAMVVARADAGPAEGYRFQGFMSHFQDYEPSADHLANMMAALQAMLMQAGDDVDNTVVLFPAWPCEWDVSFRLHAPMATVIDVDYAGGHLINFTITPASRRTFVKFVNCVTT